MEEKERIKKLLTEWRAKWDFAQKAWSVAHHASLYGSIICSVIAGAQFKIFGHPDFATLLTTLAAVLTGIAASGGFEKKWRSSRISRSKADCLLIEIDSEKPEVEEIKKQLKAAIEKHDLEVADEKKG